MMEREYDRVPFAEWRKSFTWKHAEHVDIVGPTGVGKTTILQSILPMRKYVLFLGTKTHDDSYTPFLTRGGFHRIYDHKIPPDLKRVFIWPESAGSIGRTKARQRDVFRRVLDRVFDDGNWTVVIDECHWMCHDLGLDDEIATLHHQGRSHGITMVDGMQRPAWVPVIVNSSADHGIVFRLTEPTDLKRLSGIGGIEMKELMVNLRSLSKHEFIYIPTRGSGTPVISETVKQKGGR